MNILSKVTDEMQGVLIQSADDKAIETGFCETKKKDKWKQILTEIKQYVVNIWIFSIDT